MRTRELISRNYANLNLFTQMYRKYNLLDYNIHSSSMHIWRPRKTESNSSADLLAIFLLAESKRALELGGHKETKMMIRGFT